MCNAAAEIQTVSERELCTPRRVHFPDNLASQAELPSSTVLEEPRQEPPSQSDSVAVFLDSMKDSGIWLHHTNLKLFCHQPPWLVGPAIGLPINIRSGYVGPTRPRFSFGMDSTADLCFSCHSVGFMSLVLFCKRWGNMPSMQKWIWCFFVNSLTSSVNRNSHLFDSLLLCLQSSSWPC